LVVFIAMLLVVLLVVYYILDPENKELNKNEREKLGGTYINLSDGVTHYKLRGPDKGKVVVLVHGGTVPIWTWDKLSKFLNDAGFRTLSYDKYGRGYSDRPAVTYDQELYTRQLMELVEKLKIGQRFDLIGYSLGGGTAVNFTAQYPDRVQKLVIVSPLVNNFKVPTLFQIPVIGEFAARLIGIKIVVKRSRALFEGNSDSEIYNKLFVEQTTYKGFQRSLLSMLRNNAVRDYTSAYQILSEQKHKILLIWGTEDSEITKDMIKDIRSFLPKLEFKPVEGVGHGIIFQKPQIINNLIIDFFK
jgi:pimeloyl-ACP methyl ester carboxylesterase